MIKQTSKSLDDVVNEPNLSIIVVSYNTREMTLKCIESIFQQTKVVSFELIVVDNASTDGSDKAIMENFEDKAKVILSDQNLGFAAANNLAAKQAAGEYLLLLNPDTIVINRAIDKLLEFSFMYPNAEIWGGGTVFSDYSLNPSSCWRKMSCWGQLSTALGLSSMFRNSSIFNVEAIGGWDRQGDRYVDIISGCFFLIRRNFWEKLDGFDKDFFMYGEEADLCLRAASIGATPITTSRSVIVHYGGASETVQADKLVRLLDAKTKLVRKHFPNNTKKIGKFLLMSWPLTRYVAHRVLSFFGRASSIEPADTWKKVWQRRNSWS